MVKLVVNLDDFESFKRSLMDISMEGAVKKILLVSLGKDYAYYKNVTFILSLGPVDLAD